MNRIHNVVTLTIFGTVVGGLAACLLAIVSARFVTGLFVPAIKFFAPGVLVVGLTCGAIAGFFKNKHTGVSIGGTLFLFCLCIGAGIGLLWYEQVPWPSPQPYPGTEVRATDGSIGNWGWSRSYTYTVSLPLSKIQSYYEEEMVRFCTDDWRFEASGDQQLRFEGITDDEVCHEAQCQIPRGSSDQAFSVLICSENETQTTVYQVDAWED